MTILGIAGASGGLGVSTLTCAIGAAAARLGLVVALVDGQIRGGGLQVTAGVEHEAGHRWRDLLEVDGPVDGQRLLDRLPATGGCAVLSAGRHTEAPVGCLEEEVSDEAFGSVLAGLGSAADLVVVDWGRADWGRAWWGRAGWDRDGGNHSGGRGDGGGGYGGGGYGGGREALVGDALVVLAGLTPRGLADIEALVGRFGTGPFDGLVTRAPREDNTLATSLAEHVRLPLLGHVRDDRSVSRSCERGDLPGDRPRGPLARLAGALVLAVATMPEPAPALRGGRRPSAGGRGGIGRVDARGDESAVSARGLSARGPSGRGLGGRGIGARGAGARGGPGGPGRAGRVPAELR
ncbi:MAG: hypothetical protein IPH03_04060 [Tetrasphaera sp.]|nr:hypothetical protein [Tetrasphaera sp.]